MSEEKEVDGIISRGCNVAVALALSTYLKHIDNTATERGKRMANIPTHCHCTATATWHCTATTIARPRQSRVNQFSQSRDSVGTSHVTIRRSIKCCAVLLSQHCLPISSNASTKYKVLVLVLCTLLSRCGDRDCCVTSHSDCD